MKLSPGEETLALHLQAYCLYPEREYLFGPPRRWRFDFAWPSVKLAVEVEGGTSNGGRHNRHGGFSDDCYKYNAAALLGWRVLRYTTEMVISGHAIDEIRATLQNYH